MNDKEINLIGVRARDNVFWNIIEKIDKRISILEKEIETLKNK